MNFEEKLDNLEEKIIEGSQKCDTGSKEMYDHISQIDKLESIKRANKEIIIKNISDAQRRNQEMKIKIGEWIKTGVLGITSFGCFILTLKVEETGRLNSKGIDWFKEFMKKAENVK